MPPLTVWRPQESDGQGEMTSSSNAKITSQDNKVLTTQSGVPLVIQSSLFVPTPKTTWVSDDSK